MALATLSIDLEARFARMEESLARAEREAAKSSANISRSLGSIGDAGAKLNAIFAGLLASVSVGALVASFRGVVDGLDALNDAADATGASIERLSALEDVGKRTGTSFDTVTGILVKFNAQLKEAGDDANSGAARALRALGLEVEELRRLDPAEALRKTAQAMAGFAADGDKARLTQELFGKSVREAAPFLKDLAEAGQLNATVTTQQAEEAERFNKAIFALQANSQAFARTLLKDVIPALAEFLELASKRGFASGLFDRIDAKFASEFAALQSKRGQEITSELESLQSVPAVNRDIFWRARVANLREELDKVAKSAAEANERVKTLINGPDFKPAPAPTTKQLLLGNQGYGELPSVQVEPKAPNGKADRPDRLDNPQRVHLRTRSVSAAGLMPDHNTEFDQLVRSQQQAQRLLDQFEASTRDMNASLIRDDRARGLAQIENDRLTAQQRIDEMHLFAADRLRLEEALGRDIVARQRLLEEQLKPEWQRLLEGWADTTTHMAKSFDTLMNGVVAHGEDALARLIRAGKLNVDSLVDYVQDAIARMLAQKAMAQLSELGSFLFGGFSPAATGKAFTAGGAEVTAFATGGIVGSPTPFRFGSGGNRLGLMGEAGPEAILPLKRGRGGRLGVQAAVQPAAVVNVNIAAGVSRGELAALVPHLKQQIADELVVRMRRPGFAGA